jgi:dipeptidyl aminopeptidase/acylaminoacyl peptidase
VAALRSGARRAAAAAAISCSLLLFALVASGCTLKDTAGTTSRVPGVRLVEVPGAGLAAWSPDGSRIAVPAPGGIQLRKPDGTRARTVEAPPMRTYFGLPKRIEWSPDGRWLRYFTAAGPRRGSGIWATQVRVDGGAISQTPLETELAFPAWSQGGWPVVYATGPFEWEPNGERSGPPAAVRALPARGSNSEQLLATAGIPDEPVAAADQILFKQWLHHDTELWTMAADGSDPRRLARFLYLRHYERSPDGGQIALAAVPRRGHGGSRLFVIPSAGGKPRPVGGKDVFDGPAWSPDGRWLTFSTPEGEIARVHPDGSHLETIARFDGEEVRGLRWSPDGHRLIYGARPFPSEYAD